MVIGEVVDMTGAAAVAHFADAARPLHDELAEILPLLGLQVKRIVPPEFLRGHPARHVLWR